MLNKLQEMEEEANEGKGNVEEEIKKI